MRYLWALAALFLSACSSGDDVAAAENAVAAFHRDLNAGNFNQMHDGAATEWKSATTRPDTVKLFGALRTKLGPFVSGKRGGWHVNYGTGGTTVMLQYNSQFQKGPGTETFTFRRTGDSAQLIGYNINSAALITG